MQNQLTIGNTTIHQDEHGRYCLNDLHKAAGGEQRHRPKYWLENQQTKEIISELETTKGGIPPIQAKQQVGTYVCKELVYVYANWISPAFYLKVIRTYDALMTPAPRSDVAKRVKSAINARAWALSQRNYDTFRNLMAGQIPLDDPASVELVQGWQPPAMLPASALDEAITALSALKGGAA